MLRCHRPFQATLLAGVLSMAGVLCAQNQASVVSGATFDVVSVKPNTSGGFRMRFTFQPGGRMVMVNAPVTMLLVQAFLIPSSRTIGAPTWTRSSRYDIDARASGDPEPGQMRLMARSLLVDRFQLAAHIETRETDGYALVPATPDQRLGPQIRDATPECVAHAAAARARERRPSATPAAGAAACELRAGDGTLASGAMTMEALATSLSLALGVPVLDETGLKGDYELSLAYAPERPLLPLPARGQSASDNRVSIFTAVREQLGLRLDPSRAPAEFLVIDRIEPPSEN